MWPITFRERKSNFCSSGTVAHSEFLCLLKALWYDMKHDQVSQSMLQMSV